MNLGDPELELIDPTPNVHAMFIQFDRIFFWAKLASRAVVRWSKRMYSCAGVCSYEGRGGLCAIALSEPLLKLRPRKDLVETLLHEMIHAFLFITQRVQDRDGHGPNFKEHMYRINKAAGINITIYHTFYEEVELYQTHWWRCNGPCQRRKPYFGIVRRSSNTAPGPRDFWWADHQRLCGGMFIKIKEPEKKNKETVAVQPKGDITKYVTSTKKNGGTKIVQIGDLSKVYITSNNSRTVVTQNVISNPISKPVAKPSFLTGKGYTIAGTRVRSNSTDATEMVRNIWAKKQLMPSVASPIDNVKGRNNDHVKKPNLNISPKTAATNVNKVSTPKATKHKTNSEHANSPPVKVKKIDDYFKKNATSILKDIYGSNIVVAESNNNNKLIAVGNTSSSSEVVLVDCPICGLKVVETKINSHVDECLNKDLIANICNGIEMEPNSKVKIEFIPEVDDKSPLKSVVVNKVSKPVSEEILATLQPIPPYKPKMQVEPIPPYKPKVQVKQEDPIYLDDTVKTDLHKSLTSLEVTEPNWYNNLNKKIDVGDVDKGKSTEDQRKSDNCIVDKEDKDSSPLNAANYVKVEPGPSKVSTRVYSKCPCCGHLVTKPMQEHLEECLAFFNTDPPPDEAPANLGNQTIIIDDDDDIFDESQVFNATGTKWPCPCCMQMVENDDMNTHLDSCLS